MTSTNFVHLNTHSHYSLLESTLKVGDIVQQAKNFGMPAIALTDTHNLFGAIEFYFAAKEAQIKPILGCEIFYTQERKNIDPALLKKAMNSSSLDQDPPFFRLNLLVKNYKGYQNLCQLLTQSYLSAYQIKKGNAAVQRAVVDRKLLHEFGEDLIVLTSGLRGECAYRVLQKNEEVFNESVRWFKDRFQDNFYFEIQDHGVPEESVVSEYLYQFGKKNNIKCVATQAAHYLKKEDAEAHEVLQCIDLGRNLDVDRPKSLVPREYHLRSAEEMRERFARYENACDLTLEIAEKCNLEFNFKDTSGKPVYHLPKFTPSDWESDLPFSEEDYFEEFIHKGLESRFLEPSFNEKKKKPDWEDFKKTYYERLRFEADMIKKTGFTGYFLIVADFINWAKDHGVPVGPGRGSGAGSLVAYVLKITDVDPIEYQLLFERFINPERVSLPDFDVDFCQERRGEVIDYVNQKYGSSNVSQIITFGKLQARAVIRDVGRVLGLSFAETDQITKLLPNELGIKIKDALEKEPQLRDRMETDPKVFQVLTYSLVLEGLVRNPGIHAAGVIITERPIVEYAPLYVTQDGDAVTQFDKDFSEKIGLVKFDFLGLKTLTVIDQAIFLIKATAADGTPEKNFDIRAINYHDAKVFELFASADTNGIFQVESPGMKDLCSRLKPNCIEDLTAINALFRPGPLGSGMVDDFIDCKHGRMPIQYELPILESILKETYGVILYQEQVMQIARELAGYTLGQADMLRRAMGKKKPEEMAKHRELFVNGAKERGIAEEKSNLIFDLMAKFAEYGFNKSHSAAYAFITYQTAFLKTYYPVEFMAGLMMTEINNTEKISKYVADARMHHIQILPPDVNRSQKKFSVVPLEKEFLGTIGGHTKAILFGLEAIKGVGGIAVDAIVEAREGKQELVSENSAPLKKGPFRDITDFCSRVSARKVNKKVLESLIYAGAFDSLSQGVGRSSLFESIENLLNYAHDEQEERELGQSSLFDQFDADEIKLTTPLSQIIKTVPEWSESQKLNFEKAVLGFYISGHPMETWQTICEQWLSCSISKIHQDFEDQKTKQAAEQESSPAPQPQQNQWGGYKNRPPKKTVFCGALVTEYRDLISKKGDKMALVTLEDFNDSIKGIIYPQAFREYGEKIKMAFQETEVLIFEVEINTQREEAELVIQRAQKLNDVYQNKVKRLSFVLNPNEIKLEQLRLLQNKILEFRGKCPATIEFSEAHYFAQLELPEALSVNHSPRFIYEVNKLFGKNVVKIFT